MIIKVNGIFTYNNKNFYKNGLTDELYQLTVDIARKEKGIKRGNLVYFKDNLNISIKNALEIIKSITITSNQNKSINTTSIPNKSHRKNFNFTSSLQKQIFINNFVFMDSEKFIKNMTLINITKEQINDLINSIYEKKEQARVDKEYNLDVSDIFPIEELCRYYNFNQPEIIINRLMEINYINPEIIDQLYKTK